MKITIIPSDGAVYKDGKAYLDLDLATAPANIHALQWNNTKGWIEFAEDDDGGKEANQVITELPSWADDALAAWEIADTAVPTPVVVDQPANQGAQDM